MTSERFANALVFVFVCLFFPILNFFSPTIWLHFSGLLGVISSIRFSGRTNTTPPSPNQGFCLLRSPQRTKKTVVTATSPISLLRAPLQCCPALLLPLRPCPAGYASHPTETSHTHLAVVSRIKKNKLQHTLLTNREDHSIWFDFRLWYITLSLQHN